MTIECWHDLRFKLLLGSQSDFPNCEHCRAEFPDDFRKDHGCPFDYPNSEAKNIILFGYEFKSCPSFCRYSPYVNSVIQLYNMMESGFDNLGPSLELPHPIVKSIELLKEVQEIIEKERKLQQGI